jgi:hypothetical protein
MDERLGICLPSFFPDVAMTEPSPPPPVVGFGPNENPPPGGSGLGGGPPPGGGVVELERNAKLWLGVSLLCAVVCGGGCLLSLTGAVMCFLAQKAAEQGHLSDAQQKLRWGQILTGSGIALGLLVVIGFFVVRD